MSCYKFFLFKLRGELYTEYKGVLFSGEDEVNGGVYTGEVKNINNMFGWFFILKSLAGDDILRVDLVGDRVVEDVFNFLIIRNKEVEVQKMINSKNDIAI